MSKSFNVAQRTLYDYRGVDGTGTVSNKVTPDSPNAKAYTVRKLADGNCWMTDNLVLPLAAGTTVEASSTTTATPISFTPTSCANNGECSINSDTLAANGTYYYTWHAVVAESVPNSSINVDAPSSICPVGWRIPANYTIDTKKSFGSLTNAYGASVNGADNSENHVTTLTSSPINMVRAGYYNNSGALSEYNAWARYWSSTAAYSYSPPIGYDLLFGANATHPNGVSARYSGLTARCVAL